MPRYYLHVRCGREFELDRDGVDFPDIETVKRETIAAAANVWRDFPNPGSTRPTSRWRLPTSSAPGPFDPVRRSAYRRPTARADELSVRSTRRGAQASSMRRRRPGLMRI